MSLVGPPENKISTWTQQEVPVLSSQEPSPLWLSSGILLNGGERGRVQKGSSLISGPFSHFLWESALQLSDCQIVWQNPQLGPFGEKKCMIHPVGWSQKGLQLVEEAGGEG